MEIEKRTGVVGLNDVDAGAIRGKLIALDVGNARIGIAVCDPLQLGARPLKTLNRKSRRQDFDVLANLVQQQEVGAIVCGLPLNMDGTEGDQARTVRKWAMRQAYAMRALLGRPVPLVFWDERLSTFAANEFGSAKDLKDGDDAAAAAVILQCFLDRSPDDGQDYGAIVLPSKEGNDR